MKLVIGVCFGFSVCMIKHEHTVRQVFRHASIRFSFVGTVLDLPFQKRSFQASLIITLIFFKRELYLNTFSNYSRHCREVCVVCHLLGMQRASGIFRLDVCRHCDILEILLQKSKLSKRSYAIILVYSAPQRFHSRLPRQFRNIIEL